METSIGGISLLATQELQLLTLGIQNNSIIKRPKIENWNSFIVALAWKARTREVLPSH